MESTGQPVHRRDLTDPTRVKWIFVLIYVVANMAAFALMAERGTIGGDFTGFPAPSATVGMLLLGLITAAYLAVLFPVFNGLSGLVGPRRISPGPIAGRPLLHVGVLVLQLFLLVFSLATEIGSAGRIVKTDSPLRFIVYFVPIDYIALIYIAVAKTNRLYKVNVLLYVVSSVIRGWSSVFLYLIFIMLTRTRLAYKLTPLRWLGFGLLLLLALPVAYGLRFYFRDYGGDISELSDLLTLMQASEVGTDGESGLAGSLLFLLGALFDRFQHFSSVAMEYMYQPQLRALVLDGAIRPFIFDGQYFTVFYTVLGIQPPFELNAMLTATFLGLDPSIEGYNTHTGLIGWMILLPEFAPVFLAYVFALGLASVQLARRLGSRLALNITWLMWLILLMNGWFGGFVTFVVALACIHVLQMRFTAQPRTRAPPGSMPSAAVGPA